MLTAIDLTGVKTFIENADPNCAYYCPVCQQKLMQRRGEIRRTHFAHPNTRNGAHAPCSDNWFHEKTEWHIRWQRLFPIENIEVVVEADGKKHIADVLINGTVIEFQHSSISLDEFNERNAFYSSQGYNIIWVYDQIESFSDGRIHKNNGAYWWTYVKKPFREMDYDKITATVLFQLKEDDSVSQVLEVVTTAAPSFWRFTTDTKNTLTKERFVQMAKNGELAAFVKQAVIRGKKEQQCGLRSRQILPVTEEDERSTESREQLSFHQEKPKEKPFNGQVFSGGKDLFELWEPNYRYMIVANNETGDELIIHGDSGQMQINSFGKPLGQYTNLQRDGSYSYSPKTYVVKDAHKPIWRLKKTKEIEKLVRERTAMVDESFLEWHPLNELLRGKEYSSIRVKCKENQQV